MPHDLPPLLGEGHRLQAMPVGDIAFVLEQAHRFCEEHGLGFSAYPMHEVAAHPQATAILRLFADHVGAVEFQPLTTTGVPLATRQEVLEQARVEDHLVDNENRPATLVAEEVLHRVGWLHRAGGQ